MRSFFEKFLLSLQTNELVDWSTDYTNFPDSQYLLDKNKDYDRLLLALASNHSLTSVKLKSSYFCEYARIEDCLAGYLKSLSKIPTLKKLIIRAYPDYMTTDSFIKELIAFTASSPRIEMIELENLDFRKINPDLLTELVQSVKKTRVRMQFDDISWPANFAYINYQQPQVKQQAHEPAPKLSFESLAKSVSRRAPTFNALPYPLATPRGNSENTVQDLAAVRIQRTWRAKHKREQTLVPNPRFFSALRNRLPDEIDPNPFVPTHPIRAINPQEKVRFLARIKEDNMRHMVEEVLTHHMMYLTFHDLLAGLQRCINRFNQWLAKHPELTRILLAQDRNKSQGWIAAFAAHYLTVLPNATYSVGHFTQAHLPFVQQPGRSVILMPDDGAYSGTQICQNLSGTLYELPKLKQFLDIFVIIPFMTNKAYRQLNDLRSKFMRDPKFTGQLVIHLITDKWMPSLAELPLSATSRSAVSRFRDADKCVCLTEWKKPDAFSVSLLFSASYIDHSLGNDGRSYYFNTMPDIISPYKVSSPLVSESSNSNANPLNKGSFTINPLEPTHRDFARLGIEKHRAIAGYLAKKYLGATLDVNLLLQDDVFMHQYIYPMCLYSNTNVHAHIRLFRDVIIDALYVNQTPGMKANLEEYLRLIVIPAVQGLYQEIVDSENEYQRFILHETFY